MTITVEQTTSTARSQSQLYSARKIAELALQKINAFSVNDIAADPAHLDRTLQWMDLVVAEFTGNNKCEWLVSRDVSVALDANTRTYDLEDGMGDELPPGGVMFPISAYVNDGNGNDTPVEIIDGTEYEAIASKSTSGKPAVIYIDRKIVPTLHVYPVPADTTYTLKMTVQQYAPSMSDSRGERQHGMRAEFQLWLVLATAGQIGNGPVRRLSGQVLNAIIEEAARMRARLEAYGNHPRVGQAQPRRTRSWGA